MKEIGDVLQVERRISPRYGVRLRVLFPWGERIFQAHTLDLSETGMRLETLADLGTGTALIMHVAPTGEAKTERVRGTVVWVRAPKEVGGLYACGFKFAELSEEARTSIRQIIGEQKPDSASSHADSTPAEGPQAWSLGRQQALQADHERRAERRRAAEALYAEACNARSAGNHLIAIRLLEQGMALCPESTTIIEELAQLLYFQGEVARAAELFDRALRTSEGG